MFRANSRLRGVLGTSGIDFVEYAADSIKRILPHVDLSPWIEGAWRRPGCVWADTDRTRIRITLTFGKQGDNGSRSLSSYVIRRQSPGVGGRAGRVLDTREYDLCKRIALRISEVVHRAEPGGNSASIQAIRDAFDEYVIARHITEHLDLKLFLGSVLDALHKLSEQSYENKSLSFGCLVL